ncbi:hypothetical protein NQ314_016394 [Rhamnusium bicolor]|uniref:Polycystin cation channel PKD1/PKD2 domain-containing protein n=1 Tax=Rhamnusium bicolor TaxID=1586634 RepID=A0AAV8WVZ4_9CUCU|nr:hypothetical protein NQ314_016394 [Rhamnusium bicolor]
MKLIYRLFKKKKLVFKDAWNLVDIAIIFMSLACLFLYTKRSQLVKDFLQQIEGAKHNEFVNYFHLLYAEATLTILAAVLVFLATLRLWKLLRFLLLIKIAEKTLLLSAPPLFCLFLCQIVVILAHAFSGILLFGTQSDDFKNIPDTVITLVILSLNLHKHFHLEVVKSTLDHMYYSVFMILTLAIYTLYITVITICYSEARTFYSKHEEYNVVDYIKEQYRYYLELAKIKWLNIRMRGGDNDVSSHKHVYPKEDEHRYAKCLTLPSNRMSGMCFVGRCIVRNLIKGRRRGKAEITDIDENLIKKTIVNLFRRDSEEKDMFYMTNNEGSKINLVDDATLLKMEEVTKILLESDAEKRSKEGQKTLYKKLIAGHEQKINAMMDNLNVILNILSDINIDVDEDE